MPTNTDVDYDSDSEDEENLSEIETSVLLGVPDGPIESQSELDDAAISRIGGYPAFLTTEPPISSAQCKTCSSPMELLVQLWCPFEESTMDRALYVFGCSKTTCQRKEGSIRAFRALRYNAEYAAKLARKQEIARKKAKLQEKALKEEEERKERAKLNPFAANNVKSSSTGGLFGSAPSFGTSSGGLSSQLFSDSSAKSASSDHEEQLDPDGDTEEPPPSDDELGEDNASNSDEDSDSESSSHSIVEASTSQLSPTSPWLTRQSAFKPPLYLSTSAEYVPPPPKMSKVPTGAQLLDQYEADAPGTGKSRKANTKKEAAGSDLDGWGAMMEAYENSMNLDNVFERFVKRLACEGQQCIRYELGGIPLPFASDKLFATLFPSPPSTSLSTNDIPVSGKHAVIIPPSSMLKRTYDPESPVIKQCELCGGKRTFECQLMPNLINVLRESTEKSSADSRSKRAVSEEERKKEVELLLKGGGANGRGMEWGTCMVFSCAGDCCLIGEADVASETKGERSGATECWREELVLVQWEE